MKRSYKLVVAVISAALLAACGGNNGLGSSTPMPVAPQPGSLSQPAKKNPCLKKPCIYVANGGEGGGYVGSVTVYAETANGNVAPVQTELSGSYTELSVPDGVVLDTTRKIYVANFEGGRGQGSTAPGVAVYAPGASGNVAPIEAIWSEPSGLDDIYEPTGIGLDSNDNMYLRAPYVIAVYAPGASGGAVPLRYITGGSTQLNVGGGIAVTKNGTIYSLGGYSPSGDTTSLLVFGPGANGDVAPIRILAGPKTELYQPEDVTLDKHGNIYVTDLTLDPSSGPPAILVFAKNAHGNVAPIRTISGLNTGLDFPLGIALDSHDNIYVANDYAGSPANGSITVYAEGANGNVTPIRTITGGATFLDLPHGITVH